MEHTWSIGAQMTGKTRSYMVDVAVTSTVSAAAAAVASAAAVNAEKASAKVSRYGLSKRTHRSSNQVP